MATADHVVPTLAWVMALQSHLNLLSPIYCAIYFGRLEALKVLWCIVGIAEASLPCGRDGMPPICFAIYHRQPVILQFIVDVFPASVHQRHQQRTPIEFIDFLPMSMDHMLRCAKMFKTLLSVDPSMAVMKDAYRDTCLHRLLRLEGYCHPGVVSSIAQCILDAYPAVRVERNAEGWTALDHVEAFPEGRRKDRPNRLLSLQYSARHETPRGSSELCYLGNGTDKKMPVDITVRLPPPPLRGVRE